MKTKSTSEAVQRRSLIPLTIPLASETKIDSATGAEGKGGGPGGRVRVATEDAGESPPSVFGGSAVGTAEAYDAARRVEAAESFSLRSALKGRM